MRTSLHYFYSRIQFLDITYFSISSTLFPFKERTRCFSNQFHSKEKQLLEEVQDDYFASSDSESLDIVKQNYKICENFISEEEELDLMKEIDPIFKRRRYQFDHWDGAIQGYKETEKLDWNATNSKVLEKLRKLAFPENTPHIKQVHVLDLAKSGHIKPHIDSVRFCGDTIAGISLLSSSVMRLIFKKNQCAVDCFLPRRSLYIMRGLVRYDFTHEILGETTSYFKEKLIPRDRRVSIICRNEPN